MTIWLGSFTFNKSNPPRKAHMPQEMIWYWTSWGSFPRQADVTIQQRPPTPILASSSNLSCSEEVWEYLLLTLNWDGSYNPISSALTEVRKAGLKLSNAFPLYGLINPDSTVWTEGHRLNKQHSLAENMNPVFIKTSFSMLLGKM